MKDSIPNLLSGFRLIAAPLMLYLSWMGCRITFLALLVLALLSDAIDGFIARRLNINSDIGAKLDSWGDLATYLTVPICIWWLWPEIVKQEALFVIIVLGAYIVPLIAGFARFRKLPSYHTWGAKISAVLMSIAVFTLLMTDISLPFRCAALVQALVACEEVAITLKLPELKSNVRSVWHVKQINNRDRRHT